MKKIWVLILMVLLLGGCSSTGGNSGFFSKSVSEFTEKYARVQEKIDELMDESDGNASVTSNQEQKPSKVKLLSTDPDNFYYPEDFLEVYNSDAQTTSPVSSLEFISPYSLLLEEIETDVDFDHLVLETPYSVNIEWCGEASVTFYNVLDGHILIHFVSTDTDQFLKVGFVNDLFHLVYFNYGIYEEQISSITKEVINYNYEDFVEDTSLVVINSLEGDWVTYSFIDIPGSNQSQYTFHNGVEDISFYDLDTDRVFFFSNTNGVNTMQEVVYKNEKGYVFSYLEGAYVPAGQVEIRWQLLEATGWDYAFIQNMAASNIQEGDGIFIDGENLYVHGKDRLNCDLTPWNANVLFGRDFLKSELTNEILNLSAYGMTFSRNDLTIDAIEQSLQEGRDMIDEKIIYEGVNFRSDTIKTDVLSLLDPDIQSLIAFIQELNANEQTQEKQDIPSSEKTDK